MYVPACMHAYGTHMSVQFCTFFFPVSEHLQALESPHQALESPPHRDSKLRDLQAGPGAEVAEAREGQYSRCAGRAFALGCQ